MTGRVQLIMSKAGHLTLSDDSHGPHAVGLHYKDAHQYLQDAGVRELHCLTAKHSSETESIMGSPENVKSTPVRKLTKAAKLDENWSSDVFWQHL